MVRIVIQIFYKLGCVKCCGHYPGEKMPLQPVIYLALSFRMMITYIPVTAIDVSSADR